MNVTLPEVFDLSSLSRALDEDIAAQEHAAIDYVPMDVDEWVPAPVLYMDNAPRPWYNPEPQPAWNNLELELENAPVENASQDVPGWYVNLREQNEQPRATWHNRLPVVSVRRVKSARVPAALDYVPMDVDDEWVPVPVLHMDDAPAPHVAAPRPWYNPEPQPAWNNLELELENVPVENAPQAQNKDVLRGSNYQPHPTGRNFLPVVSVRRVEKARVQEAPAPAPPAPVVSARKEEKTRFPGVLVSAIKGRAPVAPTSARKAGKARVPGIKVSMRKAESARALGLASVRNAEKIVVLGVPTSARKLEKAHAPSIPTPSPHVSAPSKPTSAHPRPMVPLRIDLSNMSSSSKVKLQDIPKVDVQMRFSWPTLAHTNQTVPPKATSSHHHRNSPITRAYEPPANNEDVVMSDNDYNNPTVPTSENEHTTSDDTHPIYLTDPAQPVVDYAKDGESTEHKAAAEDDVAASDVKEGDPSSTGPAEETGEEDGEESEDETEEERKARVARLMTEVFGDGEDNDDEEPPLAKDTVVSLDRPSTSATSDSLTVDATESISITDWSLDTPDDVGTEGNRSVGVADRDEEDEERQAYYRAQADQLLTSILGDGIEGGQSVQEAPLLLLPFPATRDALKRKREDDGPSTMPCLVTMDPRKRKRDGVPRAPTLVIKDRRKRRREADTMPTPSLATDDCRKRKREDELPACSLVTRDPRKRLKDCRQ